jgi:SAM-dependent methyltransferase
MDNEHLLGLLACACDKKSQLRWDCDILRCESAACRRSFPVVGGTPILINEDSSVFRIEEILDRRARANEKSPPRAVRLRRIGKRLVKFVPAIGANWKARQNLRRLRDLLRAKADSSTVLIIGSGEGDVDLEANLSSSRITLVRTDVYFAPQIGMVTDSHDLPFRAESFDAVVCQSVLEHVVDPFRCVSEIHRVLKPGGVVYAEVPFMQQVHAKAYDFTRFTMGGLRRLFREFEMIDAGVEGGPGMALAWSISWFFRALSASAVMEVFVLFVLPVFIFWLKYFDYFVVNSPQAADAASELYFLGMRSDTPTPDRQIIADYWLQATH